MTVIPAQAGIQWSAGLVKKLASRCHEDDDFYERLTRFWISGFDFPDVAAIFRTGRPYRFKWLAEPDIMNWDRFLL